MNNCRMPWINMSKRCPYTTIKLFHADLLHHWNYSIIQWGKSPFCTSNFLQIFHITFNYIHCQSSKKRALLYFIVKPSMLTYSDCIHVQLLRAGFFFYGHPYFHLYRHKFWQWLETNTRHSPQVIKWGLQGTNTGNRLSDLWLSIGEKAKCIYAFLTYL